MVLLSLSINLISVNKKLQQRTTSSVITWKFRFESGINKIFLHPMFQVGFSTNSCRRLVPLETMRDLSIASSIPSDMSIPIADSSTTLLVSNASAQDLLWWSLWRTSRRSRMTSPRRTSWRRKESLLNCYPKLCRNICHARKVGIPDGSSRRSISMLLFFFVMAYVCLEIRSLCLWSWVKHYRRLWRISRRHKSQLLRPTRLGRQKCFW